MLESFYKELEKDVSSNLFLLFLVILSYFIDSTTLNILIILVIEGFFL